MEAPPSFYPAKKYSDISGLPVSHYTFCLVHSLLHVMLCVDAMFWYCTASCLTLTIALAQRVVSKKLETSSFFVIDRNGWSLRAIAFLLCCLRTSKGERDKSPGLSENTSIVYGKS